MMSWLLPGAEVAFAGTLPAAPGGAGAPVAGAQLDNLSSSRKAGAQPGQSGLSTAAVGVGPGSRAVRVPHGALAARSHRSRPPQPWLLSSGQVLDGAGGGGNSSRRRQSSTDGGVVPQDISTQGPAAAADSAAVTAAGIGALGIADGTAVGGLLEHAPSAAASSVDQEFYVGSFWSPKGLAVQAGPLRQQQQQQMVRGLHGGGQLARSTSSFLGRLDSLPDSSSLVLATSCNTVELDDASSALQSPNQGGPTPRGSGGGAGRRPWSSSAGGGAMEGVYRASTQGSCGADGEGLLEGCLPADSSADPWQHTGRVLQQEGAGAAVLVRVHSGAARLERSSSAAKGLTEAGVIGHNPRGVSEVLQTASGTGAAAAAGAIPGNYSWIAKAVVSRIPQQQQEQQPRMQFDAFDELNGGEWYFQGS